MSRLPVHAAIEGFDVRENCLCVSGRKITDIIKAKAANSRPAYIYASSLVEARVKKLRSSIPNPVKIHYAIKANPHPAVVRLLAGLVDGLDVASEGELNVALRTNIPRSEISFAGPGKRQIEIDSAVGAGVVLNVESETELARITDAARRLKRRANVAIRVNPAFELKGSGMRMSGGPKQFGIDAERVPEVLRSFPIDDLEFAGFHIFTGSQNLNSAAICESQSNSLELALQLSAHAPVPPRSINIGGGFGIPYFPGDNPIDLQPIGAHLNVLVEQLRSRYPACDLVIELGRYLIGEAGIYVCEVVDRKISRGQTFLITNGGLHHHSAATGNFGQVIRRNYPVLIGNRVRSDLMEPTSIVGPLCTPMDLLADKVMLPQAQIGDLVVVFQSGAYGFSASPRGFLSHPEPHEFLI